MESKHHKLARSLRCGPSDHDLKPNAATRDQLNVSTVTRQQPRARVCVRDVNVSDVSSILNRVCLSTGHSELPPNEAAEL